MSSSTSQTFVWRVIAGGMIVGSASMFWPAVAPAQDPGVELSMERTIQATPDEMLAATPGWISEIESLVASIERLDAASRRGRGTDEGLPCLVQDLAAARALASSARAAQGVMEESIARGEQERASFEFRKIVIALKSSRELAADSERCAQGEGVQSGLTRRVVESEAYGSSTDMDGAPNDIVDYAFDPPDASPF